MNRLLHILLIISCCLLIFSCKKDKSNPASSSSTLTPGNAKIELTKTSSTYTDQLKKDGRCTLTQDNFVEIIALVYTNDDLLKIRFALPDSVQTITLYSGGHSNFIDYYRDWHNNSIEWVATYKVGGYGEITVTSIDRTTKTIAGTFTGYLTGVPAPWTISNGSFIGRW